MQSGPASDTQSATAIACFRCVAVYVVAAVYTNPHVSAYSFSNHGDVTCESMPFAAKIYF